MLARVILVVSVGDVLSFLSPPGFRAFRQYLARVRTCIACRSLFSCGAVVLPLEPGCVPMGLSAAPLACPQ